MIALLQRVSRAQVIVDSQPIAAIASGLLVFVAVQPTDTPTTAQRLLDRLLNYRVFADANQRMNLSLRDIHGGLLLVPQFTLAADTRKGNRPSFTTAAPPQHGQTLFAYLLTQAQQQHSTVAAGCFGADMQVELVNDGPVTFWLESRC